MNESLVMISSESGSVQLAVVERADRNIFYCAHSNSFLANDLRNRLDLAAAALARAKALLNPPREWENLSSFDSKTNLKEANHQFSGQSSASDCMELQPMESFRPPSKQQ